jgi:hypothetical protein
VHVGWLDEHGPGTAAGRHPADRPFPVRMPAPDDRLLVRRGIDQARWQKREITNEGARIIAAHLHPRTGSALHRFTTDGSMGEPIYDEMDVVVRYRQYTRDRVDMLARYCLAGETADHWRPGRLGAEARVEQWAIRAE